MEQHHLSQAIYILNTEGCNIFERMTADQYAQVLDLIKHVILGEY